MTESCFTVGRNRIKSFEIFTRNHENHKESCLESLESQGIIRNRAELTESCWESLGIARNRQNLAWNHKNHEESSGESWNHLNL